MRLWWNHVWKSRAYRAGTAAERRMIDIRYCVARALKLHRRRKRVTQLQLSRTLGLARSTISRVERASKRVSFDVAIRCFIALDCTDNEIADAFNPLRNDGIKLLRTRAREPFYRTAPYVYDDHRFVSKRMPLRRVQTPREDLS